LAEGFAFFGYNESGATYDSRSDFMDAVGERVPAEYRRGLFAQLERV
jgi:hypothetical protein